jgi:hypothetical protein
VRFVTPSGRKGDDFDLLVDVDSITVPVEVKSKDDATAFSPSSLASSLRDARRQIPSGGPGAVIVRLPYH